MSWNDSPMLPWTWRSRKFRLRPWHGSVLDSEVRAGGKDLLPETNLTFVARQFLRLPRFEFHRRAKPRWRPAQRSSFFAGAGPVFLLSRAGAGSSAPSNKKRKGQYCSWPPPNPEAETWGAIRRVESNFLQPRAP